VTESRGSANSRAPNATLAALMGLSAGTAGAGNPRGNCHAKSVAEAATQDHAAITRMAAMRLPRR